MGYEVQMQSEIVALLELFRGRVPDTETHAWTLELAADYGKWKRGHDVFDRVRTRNLAASASRDRVRQCQYYFEEVCLKTLYNETCPDDPFDACSPYWVIKNALTLAHALRVPVQVVAAVVAPEKVE